MKNIFSIVIITVVLVFILCSCSKSIKNTEIYEDTATVTEVKYTDAHYESEWDYLHDAFKTVYVPEVHEIKVIYKEKEYAFYSEGIYNKYRDKYGCSVKIDVTMTTYDDDSIDYSVSLK